MKSRRVFAFFVLSGFLLACSALSAEEAQKFTQDKLQYVSSDELLAKIKKAEEKKDFDFQIIDLRIEADYAKGAIKHSENIPFKKLRFLTTQIDANKVAVLTGYSAADKAPENAFIFLYNIGYPNLRILKGGWESWKKEEFKDYQL